MSQIELKEILNSVVPDVGDIHDQYNQLSELGDGDIDVQPTHLFGMALLLPKTGGAASTTHLISRGRLSSTKS